MPRLSKIGAACLSAFGFGTGGANAVTADYLVVAGGGGGTTTGVSGTGGGGGAGGLLSSTLSLSLTTSYTIIVGAGGTLGAQGSNSSINSLVTAVGGGYGGANNSGNGGNGGSGGGGGNYTADSSGGTGTAGQGNNGGGGHGAAGSYSAAGGGGGAGAAGTTPTTSAGGAGGIGVSSSITGTATYYAGGGGGASDNSTGGAGGNGGGGKGASVSSVAGVSGTANLGGGGGGALNTTAGGSGGSGVVVIRYLGAQQFGGGIVSSDGTYTIHTFKTSGQLVPMTPITASYLIVAGGGGGQTTVANIQGGGGGAGGLLTGSTLSIDTSSTYIITVGAGGSNSGTNGTNSSVSILSTAAIGGGFGRGSDNVSAAGSGGSGGGSSGGAAGTGTAGQGNNGGVNGGAPGYGGGGGGGAGAVGGNGSGTNGGAGGVGISSSITGTATYYAGGGGGGVYNATGGTGGLGGGGAGASGGATATSGTPNTGGGGGNSNNGGTGGNGGSGIVVISYAGTTQLMAGGTVTIVGGNVIHTFTSSGYLTPLTFVGRSLRFRGAGSAYLSKTLTTPTNGAVWTFSAWIKRGTLGTVQEIMTSSNTSANQCSIQFNSSDQLRVLNYVGSAFKTQYVTTQVFRDPAAWYHITVSQNSSTGFNLYVNGTRVTSFGTATGPDSTEWLINQNGRTVNIGREHLSGINYFDGYMADVRLIDGQALTPNSFGTFNSYGVWQPINYGGSYGTNGFYLPFSHNTTSTYAGQFSGSNNLTVGTTATNFLCTGSTSGIAATFEAWVNPTAYSTGASAWMYSPVYAKGGTYFNFGVRNGQVRFYWYDGGFNNVDSPSTNDVPLNTWTHIAATLSGNTIKIYVNGILKTTSTGFTGISAGGANTSEQIGYESGSNNTRFSGSISNLRVSTTVLYNNDFVPSVENLTSATATKLLTLQNSSIVDNSSNAYTITNVGSVTTAAVTPFTNTTTLVKDQGPQGNHWTPNNISLTAGSTYDSMTDVPTLTSANAANYCVLNPLQTGFTSATIADGNLKLTSTSGDNRAGGSLGASTGKWYYELTYTTVGGGAAYLGIAKATAERSSNYQNLYWNGYFWGSDGYKQSFTNGTSTESILTTFTAGDIIGFAYDLDAGTITAYKNGTSTITWTGITTGVTYIPAFYVNSGSVINVNFGQRPFAYTPPSGFVALNTYNL